MSGLALLKFPFGDSSCDSVLRFVLSLHDSALHEAWILRKELCFGPNLPALTDTHAQHLCQDRGRSFLSYNQLRSHQRKGSCTWTKQLLQFDSSIDARSELPTCFWCKHEFRWWSNLKTHIALGQCPRLQDRAEHLLHRRGAALHLTKDLSQHCVICGRWCKVCT